MEREYLISILLFIAVTLFVLFLYPPKFTEVLTLNLDERVNAESVKIPKNDVIYFGFDLRLNPKEQLKIYAPLMDYLSKKTGYQFRIKYEPSYRDVQEDIGKGVTQFAFLGPVSYFMAKENFDNVTPILSGVGTEGKTYRAVIFTTPDSEIRSIKDLKGKAFAFGSYYSTQGHLIPRKMLEDANITLNELGRYSYFDSHQACAEAVISGEFDAGGIQDCLAHRLEKEGLIKIIAISEPFPRSLVVVNKNVDERLIEEVKKALLELEPQGRDRNLTNWNLTEFPYGFAEVNESYYSVYQPLIEKYILAGD